MRVCRRKALPGVVISGVLLLCDPSLQARPCRVNLVPNGTKFGCLTCHVTSIGGARNSFGADVQVIVGGPSCQTMFWSPTLAAKDSDGDGRKNGEELGDPAGTWEPGDPAGDPNLATQPGVKDFPPPILSSVDPDEVMRDGTTAVNIHGTNFRAATRIRIGSHALLAPQFVSAELISGMAPPLGPSEPGGAKDVVATDGSSKSTLKGAITYPDLPPLVLTSVDPSQVDADGTTVVTVTGENFLSDTKIKVGIHFLLNPSPPSADGRSITGLAPALVVGEALGPKDVIATDGRGKVTLPAGVTYIRIDSGQAKFIRGDLNSDMHVTFADAAKTLNVLFEGSEQTACNAAGDSNDDGKLDMSDAVFTLNFLFKGGATPPLPYPDCGQGAAGDLDCESYPPCS